MSGQFTIDASAPAGLNDDHITDATPLNAPVITDNDTTSSTTSVKTGKKAATTRSTSDVALDVFIITNCISCFEYTLWLVSLAMFVIAIYHQHTIIRLDLTVWIILTLVGGGLSSVVAGVSFAMCKHGHEEQFYRTCFGIVSVVMYVIQMWKVNWLFYALRYMNADSGAALLNDFNSESIRNSHPAVFLEMRFLDVCNLSQVIFFFTTIRCVFKVVAFRGKAKGE